MKLRCVLRLTYWVVMLCLASGFAATAQPRPAVLDQFTGHWRGPFVAYTYDGRVVDSLVAEHRYRWDGDVQRGWFIDRYPDGHIVRARARTYVRGGTLICEVEKENGTHVVLQGRARGGAVVWHREIEGGGVESFRERVVETPQGREYQIDGLRVYPGSNAGGDATSYLLFVGRYQEVSNGRE